MKKNGFQKDRWWSVLIKTLMIMNLSIFILCLTVFSVAASETYSQKTKLSLSIHDANIEDVLKSIEDQSEFRFFYTEKPSVENKISVDCEKKAIGEVLEGIFKGTDIAYRIVGRQIALYRNTSEPSVFQAEQQKSISGKVTDSSGGALPGVTVVVKGTTNGSITDANGRYSLANIPANATLQFSFVGMKMQEIAVGNKTTINVTLAEETVGIEEVVAIGYGVQKKSDLTGSITSVKADQIKNLPVRSISEALQGRIAGVMINKSSGRPGASSEIIIRGVGSINGLSPLFIIDGVSRGNNVNYNPKDVESIEVIKDASAAAIYGAQAAGGVVLITTKKGSFNQKTEVDVSSDFGVRQITKSYNMLETVPYIKARQAIGDNYSLWSDPASLPNTNWFKELFRTGTEQSHMISIRGGTEKVSYYVSGGYENEEGIEKKNEWERFSFRANSDFKLSKHFTLGTRIYATKIMDNPYTVEIPWRTLPYMAVRNEDGSFASVPKEVEFSGGNPIANLEYSHQKNGSGMFSSDLYADWEILKGLNFITTGSAGISSGYYDSFGQANKLGRTAFPESYSKSSSYNESYTLTTTLNYAKIIAEKHDFKALVGYEIKNSNGSSLSATANSFPVDVAESFALSTNTNKTASGSLGYGRFLSQFARINYSYDNKYLLTANVRRDGSPKFGPTHKWGVFPSVSAGWKISEESFFKNLGLNWVNMVKPRVSWGILGNDAALGDFSYQKSYQTLTLHSFDEINSVAGYNTIKVINKDIKWEEIHTINAGIDLSLFENKLSASAEYYNRDTRDMIYNLPTPWSSGIGENNNNTSTMPVNIGSIVNKGWEFSVSYKDQIGDFRYSID
ncbi:MAG: SusC/RagA family TonB-linked outer membrane protein, partial [Bacteroidetes bacterium]|nr:SusC/RagA family TonB-linked outer membrane protein [Bacteroidota bacterium]